MAADDSFDRFFIAKQKIQQRNRMKSIAGSSSRQSLDFKNFISSKDFSSLSDSFERVRVFDPATTLYCFLHQILNQCSCKGALAHLNVHRHNMGLKKVSMNTAAYTKAKKRLSESKIWEVIKKTGERIENSAGAWKWRGRDVFLVDGTVINLEDTDQIKEEYPLTYSKGKAQGQPKLRLLGVFGLASGAFVDGEVGAYSGKGQAETSLFQKIIPRVKAGSVLVLDRFFTSFYLQSSLLSSGIDYVIRARDQKAKRLLGRKTDIVVTLKRPYEHAAGIYDHESASKTIQVRLIKSTIKREGFRPASIYIMSSLLCQKTYRKREVEELYLQRWGVEVDIRNLKCTLEARELKSKTPSQARKELGVSLLAYNLVRKVTVKASGFGKVAPRKISFKTSLKAYCEILNVLGKSGFECLEELLCGEILNSKYRREPRALKKRNNRYPLLMTSRKESINETWGYGRRRGQKGLTTGEAA